MKLKMSLLMIIFIIIGGSITLYLKRNFHKKVELVSTTYKKDNIDYSKYRQPVPVVRKIKTKKQKIKYLKFNIENTKKNSKKKKIQKRKTEKQIADEEMKQAIIDVE